MSRLQAPQSWRLPRALWAASLASFGSVLAHLAAGGTPPSAWVGITAWLATLGCAGLLSTRRLTVPTLISLAILAQVAFHATWMLSAPDATTHGSAMALAHLLVGAASVVAASGAEAALWALADISGLRSWRLLATGIALPEPETLVAAVPLSAVPARPLLLLPPRRGPPTAGSL